MRLEIVLVFRLDATYCETTRSVTRFSCYSAQYFVRIVVKSICKLHGFVNMFK